MLVDQSLELHFEPPNAPTTTIQFKVIDGNFSIYLQINRESSVVEMSRDHTNILQRLLNLVDD